ncbi:hypothetical protein C3B51_02270 [Pseudoalteromonas rubra]|uniref:OmpR/PhoB-type domain-containing protein n=1 Tax=Pseudoalteromonas rubra TaxID=43658 RepID=A0A4Q7ENE1_9GAMM|nr:winged helix-turn-helix domain-containing protein [Pseudoalteromonas rubra]RZM84974.1 hypothetical protein C3B51_02270 [Pseudoalteromonas rubra]
MKSNNKNIKEWLNGRKCKVGKYTINFKQTSLEDGDEVIKLEPLTMELLCYLVNCQGRYVGQRELLEHVWEGRVVSDNAIRRVVNKLRNALGDDAKSPQYIKTVPNKGYLLIASVVYSAAPNEQTANPAAQNIPDDGTADITQTLPESQAPASVPETPNQASRFTRFALLTLAVTTLILGARFITTNSQTPNEQAQRFISIPGETLFADYNDTKQVTAFTNRKNPESHYQLYLKRTDSDIIQKLTQAPHNHLAPKWSKDGDKLAYIRQTGTSSEIIVVSFDDTMNIETSDVVAQYDSVQANLLWGPEDKQLYYSHQLSERAPFALYALNLSTKEKKQVTFPESDTWGDYHARFSNNGRLLAVLRYIGSGKVELRLLDLEKGKVRSSRYLNSTPLSLVWDSADRHVLFTHDGVAYRYNIDSQQLEQSQIADDNVIAYTDTCSKDCLLALRKQPNTVSVLEIQNPYNAPATPVTMFEFSSNFKHKGHPIYANDPSNVYFRTKIEDINQIVQVSTTGETNILTDFQQNENIYDLAYNPHAHAITGLIDDRVFILDLHTTQIDYVTTQMEQSSRPNWSADGSAIYYTRDEHSAPIIIKYHLTQRTKTPMFQGAIEVKEDQDGSALYVLSKDATLRGYQSNKLSTATFEHKVPTLTYISWHIFDGALYYTYSDGQYHLAKVDLASQTFSHKPLLTNANYAKFSIHPSGKKLLLKKETEANGEIIKLPADMTWHTYEHSISE